MNTKFQEAHLNSIFSCRRVFLVPASLENLIKISKHPSGANLRVRKIIISKFIPYVQPQFEQPVREFLKNQRIIADKITETTEAHLAEICVLHKHIQYHVLLTIAFSNLPKIKILSFGAEYIHSLTRSEINLIYPSLQYVPGARDTDVRELSSFILGNSNEWLPFKYNRPSSESILFSVLYIAMATGVRGIERIDDSDGEWNGLKQSQIAAQQHYL